MDETRQSRFEPVAAGLGSSFEKPIDRARTPVGVLQLPKDATVEVHLVAALA
jgi:hypothetical protein